MSYTFEFEVNGKSGKEYKLTYKGDNPGEFWEMISDLDFDYQEAEVEHKDAEGQKVEHRDKWSNWFN